MSPLWADRLLVWLAADAVALARVRGRLRPTVVSREVASAAPAPGPRSWEGALEALREALKPHGRERLRATVVLSNRFVRYALVPADAAVASAEERLALARFHFGRIHGERARAWVLRLSEVPPGGGAGLASAVDPELLEALRAAFAALPRLRLVSVQPYLMAGFNRWRALLDRTPGWLVLLEPGRACYALGARGGWQAVQSLATSRDGEWLEQLEREQLRAAAAPRLAYLAGAAGRTPDAPGWTLRRLPSNEGAFAPALAAL